MSSGNEQAAAGATVPTLLQAGETLKTVRGTDKDTWLGHQELMEHGYVLDFN